jgi:hypothetical protein
MGYSGKPWLSFGQILFACQLSFDLDRSLRQELEARD